MAQRMEFDGFALSRDEATEFCVYHLRMAAALFEVVPDDNNKSLIEEIKRACKDDDRSHDPALAWAAAIHAFYEEMKERD